MLFDPVVGASTQDASAVVAIVGARLLVPLLIPRFPLAIVVALVLDSADQDLLKLFTEIDTSETGPYQVAGTQLFDRGSREEPHGVGMVRSVRAA